MGGSRNLKGRHMSVSRRNANALLHDPFPFPTRQIRMLQEGSRKL